MDRRPSIEHPAQSELVHQHQFGLIAPQGDRNGITRLLIPNLFECFALAIYDTQAQVGAAAHLDGDLKTFPETAINILTLLSRYKGSSYRIRTVNLTGPTEERAKEAGLKILLKPEDVESRKRFIKALVLVFQKEGLLDDSDDKQGEDLGSAPGAYLDIIEGLQVVDGPFNVTPQQIARITSEKNRYLLALINSPGGLPYIPSYIPDDGTRDIYKPVIQPKGYI